MDSFEDLGLPPELVEALSSEGIERPTAMQEAAVPVVLRGHNLVLAAGPGSGTLVAWGPALLSRIQPEGHQTRVLALTPSAEAALHLAEALQRVGVETGHSVAALGSTWAFPARAHVLFGTPEHVLSATRRGELDLGAVEVLVVDQADRIDRLGGLAAVEEIVGFLPKENQRVVIGLGQTKGLADFVERHVRRAAVFPPRGADGREEAAAPHRGTLKYRVISEPQDSEVLATVSELLAGEARHVLAFFRSEDRAADMGDYLTLHGFVAGAPGDESLPVWLGVHEIGARSASAGSEGVVVLSCDVPTDPDSLDRRHGLNGGGWVLVLPRETSHLRDVSRRTGYRLEPAPRVRQESGSEETLLRDLLARAIEDEDIAPYMLLLEPLFERFDPAEVAAAATALLRKKAPPAPPPSSTPPEDERRPPPPAWVKLFLSVGERDGLTVKDLVGAITGEADVAGTTLGKIEIRESHSLVEVQDSVARKVMVALNGTTIRGRAVRADFDRGKTRGPTPSRRPKRPT